MSKTTFELTIATVQKESFQSTRNSGWDPPNLNSFSEEIAHLHEELSEAFRAFRLYHDTEIHWDDDGRPQGVPVEFADVLIGLFYNAEREGFSLWEAFCAKMAYNETRDYAYEGRQLHQ